MSVPVFDRAAYAQKAREAISEGAVLLRNETVERTGRPALPLEEGCRVAVFGRNQLTYYKSGTGSGGMVNTSYVVSPLDAMKKCPSLILDEKLLKTYADWVEENPFDEGQGWAQEPWFQEEMPLTDDLVAEAAAANDAAIVMIGRTAGEDKDNSISEGSILLTKREEEVLRLVTGRFDRVIVLLNVGNILEMSWVSEYKPQAVMYIWQGGMEGGNGIVDLLTGKVSPSGKLTDTIALSVDDYPSSKCFGGEDKLFYEEDIYVGYRFFETFAKDRVLYPFGFGMSYTTFDVYADINILKNRVIVSASVENTGDAAGKEVVQVYVQKPQGKLGQPSRELVGFGKTALLPAGSGQFLQIHIPLTRLLSFDDSGVTGHRHSYLCEKGIYQFYVGTDVRHTILVGSLEIREDVVAATVEEALLPVHDFARIRPTGDASEEDEYELTAESVPLMLADPDVRRMQNLSDPIPQTGDQGYRLADVAEGKVSMAAFIGQLSDHDLVTIVRGEGMCSPRVTPGTAAAFGGVTASLQKFGIPAGCCADGPSGIRMDSGSHAFAMPCGTLLASTFNEQLVRELYEWEGLELRKNHVDTLLGPGINIHRSPLNGRNFEYFSEDPFLTGRMAVSCLRGMQRYGVTGTIKHFAANNQEYRRHMTESVVSARALREIYLKPFEMAVKEGGASSIMTAYNALNGSWTGSSYDLVTTILRKEWGYTGIVMSDWWAKNSDYLQDATRENVAAQIHAGSDLYMVSSNPEENAMGDNLDQELAEGRLTRGELQRAAAAICRFLLHSPCEKRERGILTVLDRDLRETPEEDGSEAVKIRTVEVGEDGYVDPRSIDTGRGQTTQIQVVLSSGEVSPEVFFQDVKDKHYHLEIRMRAADYNLPLAQLPITIYKDKTLVKSIQITGADKDWQDFDVELPDTAVANSFYIKIRFGKKGLELDSLRVVRK